MTGNHHFQIVSYWLRKMPWYGGLPDIRAHRAILFDITHNPLEHNLGVIRTLQQHPIQNGEKRKGTCACENLWVSQLGIYQDWKEARKRSPYKEKQLSEKLS